jgi:hypothetical protein
LNEQAPQTYAMRAGNSNRIFNGTAPIHCANWLDRGNRGINPERRLHPGTASGLNSPMRTQKRGTKALKTTLQRGFSDENCIYIQISKCKLMNKKLPLYD